MTIIGRRTLQCIETRWLCPAEWTETPPMVPGFKRESIRIEEAEGGMLLVTTIDIQHVTHTPDTKDQVSYHDRQGRLVANLQEPGIETP